MSDELESSPTINKLGNERNSKNLLESPIVKRKILFGKEFSFYEDGSVLVVDPNRQEYHFITREGRNKGREVRKSVQEIVKDDSKLNGLKLLGEGKGGFSKVYELNTPTGPIALKASDNLGFFIKENMQKATESSDQEDPFDHFGSSRKVVQKMSLVDTVTLLKKLDEAGISKPEFYGFTIRRNMNDNSIKEFQFMEEIDKPTMLSIVLALQDSKDKQNNSIDFSSTNYEKWLNEIVTNHFKNNPNEFLSSLFKSFRNFVMDVKDSIPDISDLEMDNIFLVGYNEELHEFDFLVIDPIEENICIRPMQVRETNTKFINTDLRDNRSEKNKVEFTKFSNPNR